MEQVTMKYVSMPYTTLLQSKRIKSRHRKQNRRKYPSVIETAFDMSTTNIYSVYSIMRMSMTSYRFVW